MICRNGLAHLFANYFIFHVLDVIKAGDQGLVKQTVGLYLQSAGTNAVTVRQCRAGNPAVNNSDFAVKLKG